MGTSYGRSDHAKDIFVKLGLLTQFFKRSRIQNQKTIMSTCTLLVWSSKRCPPRQKRLPWPLEVKLKLPQPQMQLLNVGLWGVEYELSLDKEPKSHEQSVFRRLGAGFWVFVIPIATERGYQFGSCDWWVGVWWRRDSTMSSRQKKCNLHTSDPNRFHITLISGVWVLCGSFFMISSFSWLDLRDETYVSLANLKMKHQQILGWNSDFPWFSSGY